VWRIPHLVDVAHVEHLQPGLVHQALLARVHAADADLAHHACIDGGRGAADAGELGRSHAAQQRHGMPWMLPLGVSAAC